MKRASLVIALIAAYSSVTLVLLLTYLLPQEMYWHTLSRHAILGLSQILLIPGMAALFSRLIYGSERWLTRTLTILAFGAVGVPLLCALMIFPVALLIEAFMISRVLFGVLLPLIVGGGIWILILGIRKTGKRGVQIEAARWLAERKARLDPREYRWRSRGIRWSLWIPSLTVLLVLLFLPEVWGILTHLQQPRAGQLSGYQVPTPATWIIFSIGSNSITGSSWVSGIAGRGLGRGIEPYLHFGDLTLSRWSVGTTEFDERGNIVWLRESDTVISRRDIDLSTTKLACLEYRPSDYQPPRIQLASFGAVECSSPSRLYASFAGDRVHLPAFYAMLSGITFDPVTSPPRIPTPPVMQRLPAQ